MSTDSTLLHSSHDRMSAPALARVFVSSAQTFADTFVQYVAQESAAGTREELHQKRREICAALWAAIVATFEASAFTDQEKARILPFVRQGMLAGWNKHCAGDPAHLFEITERASHYLRNSDRSSQLVTATNLMKDLLESIDPEAADTIHMRRLASMVAHRMLVDLKRLNEIKARHAID